MTLGANWAGNYAYRAREVHLPGSIEELQDLVRRSPAIRAIGSRHSFNDLADPNGALVSLARILPAPSSNPAEMVERPVPPAE